MRKFYLFMLMAVGLLISTSMSAMPERPVPPEPQAPEGVEMVKPEAPQAPTEAPVVAPTKAPNKAAMGGNVATIIRDGVETPYTDWATMMADVQDGDEIRLEADHVGTITLNKNVTLNLNGNTIDCSASTYKGTIIDVQADVTIKDGTIKANYSNNCYGVVVNANYSASIEDVLMKSQYTDGYGWGQYGVSYCVYVYADGSATIKGSSKLDGYYEAVYNIGTSTIEGNTEAYAKQYGVYNKGTLNIKENAKVTSVYHSICNYANVNIYGGTLTSSSYQGIYNYTNGAEITVKGGSIIGNNYGIYDAAGASITVNGGKIEGKNYYAIYSAENGSLDMSAGECVGKTWGVVFTSATSVAVSGGSITGSSSYGLYTNQTNTTITGGRFKGTPSLYFYGGTSSVTGGEFSTNDFEVDKGYALASQDDATYKYKVVASVAHIGGTVYGSLTEALTAAQAGDEVVVDNDITGDYIVTKAITLNTGKNTISGTVTADGVKVMVKGTGTINALAVANEGTFEIYSGTYPFNPAQYLAENISAMDNHDGTYTAGLFLARIGEDKYFFTLQEALDAVPENGVEPTEITVLQTIDNKVEIAIYGHRKTILNLNGHTLNMLGSTSLNISKNIEDNSYEPSEEDVFTVKNGFVNSLEGGVTFYAYGGVITVENLTINNSESSGLYTTDATTGTPVYNIGEGVVVNASCSFYTGTINMNAGEINGYVYNAGATFNLNGGSVSSDKTNYCFYTGGENASLNISDGILTNSYNGTTEYYVVFNKGGNVSVTGGKFFVPIYGEDSQIRQIFYSDNNNFDIKGGTYNVSSNDAKFGNVALASGYYCMLAAEEGWFVVDNNAVAIVNNIAYATMDAAIAAAQPKGSRIVLTKDYDGDIAIAFNDTIDLRDYKVNGIIKATNGATVFVDGKTSASANGFEGDVKVLVGTYDFDPTAFLADNCSVDTETVPGKYIVTKGVVSYNGKLYASLADAVAATTNDPAVITVLRNFGLEAPLSIASKKDITIELAGFTISNDRNHDANFSQKNLINNLGKLTIQDNTADEKTGIGTGKIVYYPIDEDLDPYPHWTSDAIYNNGTIIVKSGIILNGGEKNGASASYAVDNAATSTLKISGGEIISNGNSYAIRLVYSATGNDILEATGGILGSVWGQSNGDIAGGHIYLQNVTLLYGISLGYLGSPKFEVKLANVYIQNGKFVSEFNTSEEGSTDAVMIESYYLDHRFPHLSNGFFRFHDDYYHSNIYTSKVEQEKLVRPESEGWRYVQSETDPSITYIYMTAEGLLHYFHENLMPGYGLIPYINEAEGITAEDGWYKVVLAQGTTGSEEVEGHDGELGNPWHQDKTWNLSETDVVPQDTTPVLIDHNVYVEEGSEAIAASIQIESGQTLTVKSGATLQILDAGALFKDETAKLVIEPTGVVSVGANGIIADNVDNIVVQTNGQEVGVFLVDPKVQLNTQPQGTVEMIANVGKRADNEFQWHRFALPVVELKQAWTKEPDHPTYLYAWDYGTKDWEPVAGGSIDMIPFLGYTITIGYYNEPVQDVKYTFTGNLLGNEASQIDFTHIGYGYFGNSYTGHMLTKVLLGDVMGLEGVVGTAWMWDPQTQSYTGVSMQDLIKDRDLEDYQREIAPMQTFILKLNSGDGATIDIDYADAIWSNPRYGLVPEPVSAPAFMGNDDAFISLTISSTSGQMDKVRMTESKEYSDEYENGVDAPKFMNEGKINMFTTVDDENYTSLYTNNLEGKILTLQTMEDARYTLTIGSIEGSDYALVDLQTGNIISLVKGTTYDFVAQPNATEERFQVIRTYQAPTSMDKVINNKAAKGIFTPLGQYIGESNSWTNLPSGVYFIDGVKIVK